MVVQKRERLMSPRALSSLDMTYIFLLFISEIFSLFPHPFSSGFWTLPLLPLKKLLACFSSFIPLCTLSSKLQHASLPTLSLLPINIIIFIMLSKRIRLIAHCCSLFSFDLILFFLFFFVSDEYHHASLLYSPYSLVATYFAEREIGNWLLRLIYLF